MKNAYVKYLKENAYHCPGYFVYFYTNEHWDMSRYFPIEDGKISTDFVDCIRNAKMNGYEIDFKEDDEYVN